MSQYEVRGHKGDQIMNKEQLVRAMAQETGMSLKKMAIAVDAFTSCVETAVSKDDKVTLVGFGTYSAQARAARKCRNPRTGEEILVPAKKAPVFKAGKAFKDAVKA